MASVGTSSLAFNGHSQNLHDEQTLVRHWLFEGSLTRIRWGAIPITLLLIPLFPSIPVSPVILLTVLVGAGNAWIARQIGGTADPTRLRRARWGATGLDWAIAAGSIALFSPELINWTPGLLLLLVFTTAFRFGQVGLMAAAITAMSTVTGLIIVAVFVHGAYEPEAARRAWLGWTLLIMAAACVANGLMHASHQYVRWEGERWTQLGDVLPRFQFGITDREWQVLRLLAREEMTYRRIATELHLSPETIKTHVRKLGENLDASGRHNVVKAARHNGLLPATSDTDGVDNPAGSGSEIWS